MTTNKGVILVDGGDPYHKADPGMLKAVYHYSIYRISVTDLIL